MNDESVRSRGWFHHLDNRRWAHAIGDTLYEHGRHLAECIAFRCPEVFDTPWVRSDPAPWSDAKRLTEWGGPYYPDRLSEI